MSEKMNPKWKAKWLAALRSGKYKQGRHYLRVDQDHYCCLGVLCDLVAPLGWVKPSKTGILLHQGKKALPSKKVMAIAQLSLCIGNDGTVTQAIDVLGTLADMNDRGRSFDEIANFIEKRL